MNNRWFCDQCSSGDLEYMNAEHGDDVYIFVYCSDCGNFWTLDDE